MRHTIDAAWRAKRASAQAAAYRVATLLGGGRAVVRAPVAHLGLRRLLAAAGAKCAGGALLDPAVADADALGARRPVVAELEDEIGRASCRDGVEVVAVAG